MEPSVTHGSFTIGRTFRAPVEKVWQAFADQTSKERWFKGPDEAPNQHSMDFRIGGQEHNTGQFHDGTVHRFEARYFDIVPNQRIIYAYEMYLQDERISVSLATIELQAQGNQTYLQLTEDGAYLDGKDTMASRQQGTELLLDALRETAEAL